MTPDLENCNLLPPGVRMLHIDGPKTSMSDQLLRPTSRSGVARATPESDGIYPTGAY